MKADVAVDRLAACLRLHPDWAEAWIQWSGDQLWSPAWYLVDDHSGSVELGFFDGRGSHPTQLFTNRAEAAAEFALRTLGPIAEEPAPYVESPDRVTFKNIGEPDTAVS